MGIRRREIALKGGSIAIRYQADAGRHPVTGSRKGRRKDFEKRADAAAWLYDQTKSTPALGSMTVRELGERFVQYKKLFRERSTYEKYEQHFRNHLNPIQLNDPQLAGLPLGDIQIAILQKRHLKLVRERLLARLSPAMLKKVWSTLAYAFDYAVDLEELSANPVWAIKIEKVRVARRRKFKQTRTLPLTFQMKRIWPPF
jgi:hypothetical protein